MSALKHRILPASRVKAEQVLNARLSLSAFYFIYFCFVGGLAPFFPLYLHARGFNAWEVGSLMAVIMATKVVAPNFWGWLADHTGKRLELIRFGSLMAAACFAMLQWVDGFAGFALGLMVFSAFWNAVLPQFEVLTLLALQGERERYSQIRLWGSVGFIAMVNGLGVAFEVISVQWLGVILAILLCLITLNTLWVPRLTSRPGKADFRGFIQQLRAPDVWPFFLMALLLQLSFGPYYAFFSLYLDSLGYSRIAIGLLWSLGVLAEIILFTRMHSLLARFSLRTLFSVAVFLTLLRWLGVGYLAESLPVLLLLQCLHAASFGIVHAASIEFIHRVFHGRQEGQGQALYGAASFGVGGSLGAWLAGGLYLHWGPQVTFTMGALVAALAWWVSRMKSTSTSQLWARSPAKN